MDWIAIALWFRHKIFEIVTLVLAVMAIGFAAIQYGDSREQLHQSAIQLERSRKQLVSLESITSSIQTRYVGEFPHNIEEIIGVIDHVSDRGQLDIMADVASYAVYSHNSAYQKYLGSLIQARQSKKVTVRMLVYDSVVAEKAIRTQFKDSDFQDEKKHGFRGFFDSYPPVPPDYDRFVKRLLDLNDDTVHQLCVAGVYVRRVPPSDKYLFFVWATNNPEAVFAFRNETARNRELSFHSVDRSLIEVFKTVFEHTWSAIDPIAHPGLRPAQERACLAAIGA